MFRIIIFWSCAIGFVSIATALLCAALLFFLDLATEARNASFIWIMFLPIAGFFIGWMYQCGEEGVKGGNDLVIREIMIPQKLIHWKLSPLVFVGTVVTHLFGGSAGREGTAVQFGASIGDQIATFFPTSVKYRKTFLRMGVAAGFSAIFGTPIAGIAFALEMARRKKFSFVGSLPMAISAFLAHGACLFIGVNHVSYTIYEFPEISIGSMLWMLLAGVAFGLTALLFSHTKKFFTKRFSKLVPRLPFRGLIGGGVIALFVLGFKLYDFSGLGIPVIQQSFIVQFPWYFMFVKLLLTAFTLAAGFKGGEATPLFFMGAVLGSFLSGYIPLPLSFLTGLGFIAVFAGATNTPIASGLMGCELFGWEYWYFFLLVCFFSYLTSGRLSVYQEQSMHYNKYDHWKKVFAHARRLSTRKS